MAFSLNTFSSKIILGWELFAVTLLLISTSVYSKDDTALVFTAKGAVFSEVMAGLSGDLEEELNFVEYPIGKGSKSSEIAKQISSNNPKVVVLIGNSSINLYKQYQKENPEKEFPPSIAVAALFIDNFIGSIKNASGIRYEIPAVTSLVNMRSLVKKPIKRVGVIYRDWMDPLITENEKYCKAEGISLVKIKLPNKDSNMLDKLKSGIDTLLDKGVDAIWVLNDNELLNNQSIGQVWIPKLSKSEVPVLVGIKPLLKTQFNFGSFAIVPDHYALGVQAASILSDLMDEDWDLGEREVEQPLSVKKIVNIAVLNNKSIPFHKEKLREVDEVIK